MTDTATQLPTVSVPATFFPALSAALAGRTSPAEGAQLFRETGYALGGSLYDRLQERVGSERGGLPEQLEEQEFWSALGDCFADLGWSRPAYAALRPGIAVLDLERGVEAVDGASAAHPGCHLTVGILADMLRRVAGEPVAVLEVECRSRGDERCRFLVGGEAALGEVYDGVRGGAGYQTAVAELG